MHRIHPAALVICASWLALAGCKASGDGELRGVRYHVDLEGSYRRVDWKDREQVWVPSADDRPFVSLRLAPRPRPAGGAAPPCDANEGSVGTSNGGFQFVRKGDGVDLAFTDGMSVMIDRCVPPGEEGLMCTAEYADGKMSPEQKAKAVAACKSLMLR